MRRLLLTAAIAICAWAQSVSILSQEQVQELEKWVAQHQEDRESQKFLGQNYAFVILGISSLDRANMVTGVDEAKAASKFALHARDVISTSSLAGLVGEGGQALWSFNVRARSYQIGHGSRDLATYSDAAILAAKAIDRAILLEPKNDRWHSYRIPILVSRSVFGDTMSLATTDAYGQMKQDMAVLTGESRYSLLTSAAKLAVKADALDDAESYAQELLNSASDPKNWNYGNAIFFGNMVLGQVALRRGDKEKARTYLATAGKTSGSPQLNSFGPNMSLAKDLLEAGERQVVVAFFDLCRSFWKLDRGKLQQWASQVNTGGIPDFGANLFY